MNTFSVTCRDCLCLNPRFAVQGVCGKDKIFKNIGVCGCVDSRWYTETVSKSHVRSCPCYINNTVLVLLTLPNRASA